MPEGADAYILKGVIHDWPDDDALRILRNARRAIRADGTLLLIDRIVDSPNRPAGLMDLLMLVVGGRERTEGDFHSLLAATGFAPTRIIPTEASSLIECHPVLALLSPTLSSAGGTLQSKGVSEPEALAT